MSFGVPVYNEERAIRRCLDSILAQDFHDFEVIVSDNASTDRTPEILASYAERDPRVRVFRNDENIGLIRNFNRTFHLGSGDLFRWVGADDWLDPQYASRCVAALDADPGAIAATSGFALHDADGTPRSEPYVGERLESPSPARRFAQMLWFFHAGARKYEPLYSLMRRDVLVRTGLVRHIVYNDYALVAELSLAGRFTHVPEVLFHRGWRTPPHRKALAQKMMTGVGPAAQSPYLEMVRVFLSIVRSAPLSSAERARCYATAVRYFARELWELGLAELTYFRREGLGLTRARLRRLIGAGG